MIDRLVPSIDERAVEDIRDEVVADTFDFVAGDGAVERFRLSEDRTDWIDSDHFDVWKLFFEFTSDSS